MKKYNLNGYGLYAGYDIQSDIMSGIGSRTALCQGTINSSTGYIASTWQQLYEGVQQSNNAIGNRNAWNGMNMYFPATSFVDSYENIDGTKFDWDDIHPGYTKSAEAKKKAIWCTFDSKKCNKIIKYPDNYDALIKNWSTGRDPRLAATVITPYATHDGLLSTNKLHTATFAYGTLEGEDMLMSPNPNSSDFMVHFKTTSHAHMYRKFIPVGNMNGEYTGRDNNPINFPVIRLANVYLMMAEAYNKIGKQTEAVGYINKVRRRVGMPEINNGDAWMAANSADEVFERMMHERAVELAAEGNRRFDLNRWGLSVKMLNGVKDLSLWDEVFHTRSFTERDMLWPIPATELMVYPDSKLTQNPGW